MKLIVPYFDIKPIQLLTYAEIFDALNASIFKWKICMENDCIQVRNGHVLWNADWALSKTEKKKIFAKVIVTSVFVRKGVHTCLEVTTISLGRHYSYLFLLNHNNNLHTG